jgi:hypothetical protein
MTDQYRKSIFDSMDQKETEELVEIWQKHDPDEWTETAYDVIEEILRARLGKLPQIRTVVSNEKSRLEDEADKFYSDEYHPEFYNPKKVLNLEKWINYAIYIAIASVTLQKISQFDVYRAASSSYIHSLDYTNFLVILLAIIMMIFDVAFYWVLIYFPFKALKKILQILMQMEFNSRV